MKYKTSASPVFRYADEEDKARFSFALETVKSFESDKAESLTINKSNRRINRTSGIEGGTNIGGLGEKSLHLILKYYLEENRDFHEVGVLGKYYADILRDGEAIEIQTRGFHAFRRKIEAFSNIMPVTIVHPIISEKTLVWVNPESGEMSGFRKSPKHEDIFGVFREVYSLGELLARPNISFLFPVLKCTEYKLCCGWSADGKKGSVRLNRIPTELVGEFRFSSSASFIKLFPAELRETALSVSDVSKALEVPYKCAYYFLVSLCYAGKAEICGKSGRKNLYCVH